MDKDFYSHSTKNLRATIIVKSTAIKIIISKLNLQKIKFQFIQS